jgi:transposase
MQFLGEEREVLEVEKEIVKEVAKEESPVKSLLVTNGLHLEYNGSYQVEALSTLFTKLQLLLEGEPNKYRISLSLSEIVE